MQMADVRLTHEIRVSSLSQANVCNCMYSPLICDTVNLGIQSHYDRPHDHLTAPLSALIKLLLMLQGLMSCQGLVWQVP